MADTLFRLIGADGTPQKEDVAQTIGRILLPLKSGPQTIPQALADRPTQSEVAAAIAGGGADLSDIRASVAAALATADEAQFLANSKAAIGGQVGPDTDWAIPSSAVHIVIPQVAASRTWSLPDVDGYPRGQDLVVLDEGRFLGFGPTVTLIPLAGSGDTIRDYPDGIVMQDSGMTVRLRRGLLSDVWVLA